MDNIEQTLNEIREMLVVFQKPIFTLREAALVTGMSDNALRNHLSEIGYYKPAKMIYIDRDALLAWMRSNPVPSDAEIARRAAIFCDNNKSVLDEIYARN